MKYFKGTLLICCVAAVVLLAVVAAFCVNVILGFFAIAVASAFVISCFHSWDENDDFRFWRHKEDEE